MNKNWGREKKGEDIEEEVRKKWNTRIRIRCRKREGRVRRKNKGRRRDMNENWVKYNTERKLGSYINEEMGKQKKLKTRKVGYRELKYNKRM